MGMDDESRRSYARGLALFSSILGDLIGYTGAGVFLGWAAHRLLGISTAWMILSGGIGMAVSFFRIYQRSLNRKA